VSRIEALLESLEPGWPETPDPWPTVAGRLAVAEPPRRRWVAAVAAMLIAGAALGGALFGAIPVVAEGLGMGSVDIKTGTVSAAAAPLDLGDRVFDEPVGRVPAALGAPDAVYRTDGVEWLVYLPRPELPEVLDTGVGAVIARIEGEALIEKVVDPTTTSRADVTVGGLPAVWLEGGPHDVLVRHESDGVVERRGRLAGQTLLWVDGAYTYRIESGLDLDAVVAIADSMEP
jgi:hypothetical protein